MESEAGQSGSTPADGRHRSKAMTEDTRITSRKRPLLPTWGRSTKAGGTLRVNAAEGAARLCAPRLREASEGFYG
jgi:hypothetical protein